MATKTINLDTPTVAQAEPADRTKPVFNPMEPELLAAAEFLLQVATKHGFVIAGFLFKADPAHVTVLGNCKDCADLKLYVALCQFSDKQREAGHVLTQKIGMIQ